MTLRRPSADEPLRLVTIEIEKRADGSSLLRCTRGDGSVTWQKTKSRHGAYFPLHDLIHYAVETVLGIRSGFFGLVEQGWDIEETTGKGAKGPLPPEATTMELIVGLLTSESASDQEWSATEFSEQAAVYAASRGADVDLDLTDSQLRALRSEVLRLHELWGAVPTDASLRLEFAGGV